MIILGVDPGTARCGWGVVEKGPRGRLASLAYGCIETPKEETPERRLLLLEREFNRLLAKYRPDAVSIERLFFFRNLTTALPVSEAKGVLLLAAAKKRIPLHEFTPLQVKMGIAGYGRADKRQVQLMVQEILALPRPPKPDDAADALGLAIVGAHAAKG